MGVDYEDCMFVYEDVDSGSCAITWRRYFVISPLFEGVCLFDKEEFRFSTVQSDRKILARKELIDW